MSGAEIVHELLEPVLGWLAEGGDAWKMDLRYWKVRRRLMKKRDSLPPEVSKILSNVDTALDVFSPERDRAPFQTGETQLRAELERAVSRLQALGYLE
jgi:hypothetical protein